MYRGQMSYFPAKCGANARTAVEIRRRKKIADGALEGRGDSSRSALGPLTNSPRQFDARRECLVSVRMSGDVARTQRR